MAAELMLINPRHKRRRRSGGRKRRMTAKQRRYFGPRRSRRTAVAAPRRRRRRVARFAVNPRRRVRHHRRRIHRMRRNPMSRSLSTRSVMNNAIVPAAIGAAGAVGLDYVLGVVAPNLPTSLTTGIMAPLTRVAGALLIGYGVGKVAGRKAGGEAAVGALTVVLYGVIKGYMATGTIGRYPGLRGIAGQTGLGRGLVGQPGMTPTKFGPARGVGALNRYPGLRA